MPYDQQLAERVRSKLENKDEISEIKMFGGICFTLRGNMVCGVINRDLVVRLGPEKYEHAVEQSNVRKMDFTGKALKGFIFVNESGTSNDESLGYWVESAIEYVRTLPPK